MSLSSRVSRTHRRVLLLMLVSLWASLLPPALPTQVYADDSHNRSHDTIALQQSIHPPELQRLTPPPATLIPDADHTTVESAAYTATIAPETLHVSLAADPGPAQRVWLNVRLQHVQRGSTSLPLDHAAFDQHAHTDHFTRHHSESLIETLYAHPTGMKHDLVLTQPPEGTGDLTVTYHLQTPLRPVLLHDSAGLAFVDPGSEAQVSDLSMGAVAVIDAAGHTTYAELHLHGKILSARIPQMVLETATYPLTIDPFIGDSTMVSEGTSTPTHSDVVAGRTQDTFVTVYHDTSTGADRIFAQLFHSSGTVSATRFLLSGLPGTQPVIAENPNRSNTTMFAAWVTPQSNGTTTIAVQGLTESGPVGSTMTYGSGNLLMWPQLTRNTVDEELLLTWYDAVERALYAQRLDDQGHALGSPLTLYRDKNTGLNAYTMTYTSQANTYVLAYRRGSSLSGLVMGADGTLLSKTQLYSTSESSGSSLKSTYSATQNQHLLVWNTGTTLRALRVHPNGSPASSIRTIVNGTDTVLLGDILYSPSANRYSVTWTEPYRGTLRRLHLSSTAVPQGSIWTIVTEPASTFSAPALSEDTAGQRLALLWNRQTSGRSTVAGTVVQVSTGLPDTSGLTFNPKELLTGKSQIRSYRLGTTVVADQTLLAWIDQRGTLAPTIQFRLIDHAGVPLSPSQTLTHTMTPHEVTAVLLSPTRGWLLGWVEQGTSTADIYVVHITPTGTVNTATKTLIASVPLPKLVADLQFTVNTTTFEVLASWRLDDHTQAPEVHAQRLTATGSRIGAAWTVATAARVWATAYHNERDEYFVLWSPETNLNAALWGQRYSGHGTALTSAAMITPLNAPPTDMVLRVMPHMDRYLVAHSNSSTRPGQISVSTLAATGDTLIDMTVVSSAARTFDGFDLVVADAIQEYMLLWVSDPPAIHMQRWTQAGVARGSQSMPFSDLAHPQYEPYGLFHAATETYLLTTNLAAHGSSDSHIFGRRYLPLRAQFIQTPRSLDTIVVTDTSTPLTGTTRLWEFGDGSTATTQVVTHTYTTPGTYPLTLTVTNGAETLVVTDQVTIEAPLIADFALTLDHSTGTVTFTDTSTPAAALTGWAWDFGDGFGSFSQHPTHIYHPGTYTVTLTVSTLLQTATTTQVITRAEPLSADFAVALDHATSTATFTDRSTPAAALTGWAWDFGDGTTSSLQHPTHTYTAPGTYPVTLSVTAGSDTRSTTQTLTLAEPPVTGPCSDAVFEPDNIQSDAIPLRPSQFVQRVLCVPGDVDWYVFHGVAHITYTLKTQDLGIDVMTILTLYDAAGQEIATHEPSSSDIKARYQSTLHFRPTTSGMYAVAVQLWEPDWGHAAAVYTLSLESDSCADPAPPAPTRETAITLPIGTRVSHALCTPDSDVFRIDATANTIYHVEVSSYGQDLAGTLGMTMSDSLGTQTTVAPYHWRSPTVADRTVRRDYIYADTDAPWFLFLRSLNTADPAGWYDIQVTPISCSDAATEPNNIRAEAALLTLPQSYTGSFCQPDDDDWFAVDVQAGTTYRFGVSSTHPDFTLNAMRLYAAGSDSHVAWASYPYALTYTPSTSGRYYLLLDPLAQTSHPESVYTLDVSTDTSCRDPFDPPSGPMTPTLTVDTWVEHHFCTSTDLRDVSTVTVPTTATYEFAVDTGVTGVKVTLFRNNQQVVQAPSYNNPVLLSHELYPGTYQLVTERSAVGAQGDRSLSYRVCVSTRSCYDQAEPNNTWDRATPLALGTVHAGVLHAHSQDAQDIDYLALELEAGVLYDITFDGEPGLLPNVTVERGSNQYHTSLQAATSHGTLAFLPPHTATYLLRIDQTKGNVGVLYPYTVRVAPRMSVRENTPNETPDQAIALAIATAHEGRLHDGADVDWYAIHVPADGYYDLHMTDMGPFTSNMIVTLYDDMLNIVQQHLGTPDRTARERALDPVFLQQRTYFIRIIDHNFAMTYAHARYTLRLVPVERPTEDRSFNPWEYGEHADLEHIYMDQINAFRQEFGLLPLAHNDLLTHASRRFSTDAEEHGSLSPNDSDLPHIGSDGSTPQMRADDAGYQGRVSENAHGICRASLNTCLNPAPNAFNPVESWKNSRPHRKNLLNPTHREMGLGISPHGGAKTFLGAIPAVPSAPIVLNRDSATTHHQNITVTLDPSFAPDVKHAWHYALSHDPDFSDATWTPLTATTRVFTDTYFANGSDPGDVYTHILPVDVSWTLLPGTGLKTVFVAYRDPNDRTFVGNATIWLSTPAVASPLMPPLPPLPQYFQTDRFVGAGTTKIAVQSGTGFLPPAVGIRLSSFMADHGTAHQGSSVGHGASLSSYAILRVPDATPDSISDDLFAVEWDGMLYPLVQDRQQPAVYYLEREESAGEGLAGIRPVFQKVMRGTHNVDGGEAWIMTDTAGLTWTFGTTLNSAWRYRDAADTAHIWRWNLAEVEDRQTNVQTWTYDPDTINGTYERGGVVASIQWGGNRTLGTTAHREVIFNYESRFASGGVLDRIPSDPFYLTQRLKSIDVEANNSLMHRYHLTYTEQADGTRTRLLLDTFTRTMSDGTTTHTAFDIGYSAPATSGEGYRFSSVAINAVPRETLTYERRAEGSLVTYPVRTQTIETDGGTPATMTFTYGPIMLDPSETQFWGYTSSKVTASEQGAARSETPPPGDSSEQRMANEPPNHGKPYKDTCEDEEGATGSRSQTIYAASTVCHTFVTNYEAAQFATGRVRLEYPEQFTDIRQADGTYETHQINTTYSAAGYPVYEDHYGDSATPEDDVFIAYSYHPDFSDLVIDERIVDHNGTLLARTTTAYYPGTRFVAERGRWLLEENRVLTTTMAYDVRGQRTVMTDTLGYPTFYAYNADGNQTTVTNSLGYTTTSTYDALGRVAAIRDARGATTTYTYDPITGLLMTTTNALGEQTTFGYDEQRRKIRETTPDGATTQFGYTDLGNLAVITNALGYTTTFGYDSRGHQIWVEDALGNRRFNTYEGAQGLLVATTDALGHTAHSEYDGAGRTVVTRDPRGATSHTAYDGHGRVVTTTNALGFTDVSGYDVQGRVISTTNALGDTTMYGYDSLSRQTVVTDALGYVTQTIYDDLNRPIRVIDPRGAVTHTAYDALGRVISTTDALSYTTMYGYDAVGNQTIMTDTLGSATETTYDLVGRRTSTTDARGSTTSYGYDAMGRQTIMTDTRGFTTTYGYDLLGRQIAITDALSLTSFSGYDALGRKRIMTDTEGSTTTYGYDALGRQTAMTDTLGGVTTMAYNASGQMTMTTDTLGFATTYQPDMLGQVLTTTMPLSTHTHMQYDALGRVIAQTDPLGVITTFTYDANGRLTHVVENAVPGAAATTTQNVTTTFVYDPGANLINQIDANGHAITHTYDLLGRRTTTTDPLGEVTRLTYTPRGELATSIDAMGQTTAYTYDDIGRLAVINYPPGTPDVSYVYDEASNVITMTDGLGTTTYTYDPLNRMATRTRDGYTLTYTSTARGQVAGLDYWNSGAITMTHDGLARVATLTAWNGASSSYSYRGSTSSITNITRNTGLVSTFGYDPRGQLRTAFHAHDNVPLFQQVYTYDLRGDQRTQTDWLAGSGPLTTTLDYDARGRVRDVSYPALPGGPAAKTITYDLDAVGNRRTTDAAYDAADQQLGFVYDKNGNLLNDGTTRSFYDGANRLIKTITNGITTTYGYDGWGNLVRETIGTTTTATTATFILDERQEFPRVVGIVESSGTTTMIAYGPEGVHAQRVISGTTDTTTHTLLDHHGTVRMLVAASGTIVRSTVYDIWGTVRATSGTVNTRLGYTGELMGAVDGTVYLRARHYRPDLGRFLQRDTFAGIPTSPQSLHKYTYTHNNPIRYTDPSGHIVWFAAVPLILGVVEVGLSIYDLYETGKTLLDPCASNFEKGVTVALFVGGIFMPGGGYTAGGKAAARNIDSAANYAAKHLDDVDIVDDVQDVYKVTNKLDDARDANQAATTIDDVDTIKKFDDLPCVPNSFVAGTLVESSDGLVPIETLAEGDLVWAVDPETGAAGWYPITWTTKHEDADLVTLSVTLLGTADEALSSTQEHTVVVTITATLEHPFWVEDAGWIDAGNLQAGDTLLSADGRRLVVQAAVRSSGPAMVYNFTVDALHTYTITELRVVVHNTDWCRDDFATKGVWKNPDAHRKHFAEFRVGTWEAYDRLSRENITSSRSVEFTYDWNGTESRIGYFNVPSKLGKSDGAFTAVSINDETGEFIIHTFHNVQMNRLRGSSEFQNSNFAQKLLEFENSMFK